ncbi:MAG: hypothetical protein ACFFBD_22000 [Candidatus Hodarchaeota archaeon]
MQRQAQLKEHYHPVFQSETQAKNIDQSTLDNAPKESFQQKIAEEQRRHRQKIEEIKRAFQEERNKRLQEPQADKQRHQREIEELKHSVQ